MGEKIWIFGGLAVFLVLVVSPIWYALGIAKDAPGAPADLEMPQNSSQCVRDREYMIANHMTMLVDWRDQVVREADKEPIQINGADYPKSLTKCCMECHTSRATFCTRCHEYANVLQLAPIQGTEKLLRGIRCWNCHLDAKGD